MSLNYKKVLEFFGVGVEKRFSSELESELKKDSSRSWSWNRNRKKIFFGVGVGFRNEKCDFANHYLDAYVFFILKNIVPLSFSRSYKRSIIRKNMRVLAYWKKRGRLGDLFWPLDLHISLKEASGNFESMTSFALVTKVYPP
jgi:hypothetical protein